jgi:hypothetical protein
LLFVYVFDKMRAMAHLPDSSPLAGWLRQLVEGSRVGELSDSDRVDAIRALEDLKAQACAAQARLSVDLDASVRAQHAELGLPAAEQGRGVSAQVAAARRESPVRGSRFLGLAKALTGELPHTLAAMEAGALSEWQATLIARETACLNAEDRALVDRDLCATDEQRGYAFEGWGTGGWPRRRRSWSTPGIRTRWSTAERAPRPIATCPCARRRTP